MEKYTCIWMGRSSIIACSMCAFEMDTLVKSSNQTSWSAASWSLERAARIKNIGHVRDKPQITVALISKSFWYHFLNTVYTIFIPYLYHANNILRNYSPPDTDNMLSVMSLCHWPSAAMQISCAGHCTQDTALSRAARHKHFVSCQAIPATKPIPYVLLY